MEHSLDELEALARQFDTDKQAGQNGYLGLYLEYFKRHGLARDAKLDILEIGTNKGSSLRMWAEYFPNARIYGLDITRQYELPGMLDHDRIKTALVDQGDLGSLKDVLHVKFGKCHPMVDIATPTEERQFDIIIDDASHDQHDQQVSWGYLWVYLKSGGLYVIEDIITGEIWWDANLYNVKRIMPTRGIVKLFEQTGKLTSDAMQSFEVGHIEETYEYCEYRESPAVIYERHHPQLAFIGKKS